METSFSTSPWYKRPSRVGLLILAVMAVVVALIFLGMVGWYWWQIKQGTGVPPANFSVSSKAAANVSVDRNKLESGLNPFLVRSGGPITIVEFMDYKCPYSRASASVMNQIIGKYGSKVNIIVRNFPGESIYPGSRDLSRFAYCGFRQNRFLKVYNYLFLNRDNIPQPLTAADASSLANNLDLQVDSLKSCLNDPATLKKIDSDLSDGVEEGVRGTPTFFVNGQKIEGSVSFESWRSYIESFK